jgi:replication initiation and membrane attachment protein DnaB
MILGSTPDEIQTSRYIVQLSEEYEFTLKEIKKCVDDFYPIATWEMKEVDIEKLENLFNKCYQDDDWSLIHGDPVQFILKILERCSPSIKRLL